MSVLIFILVLVALIVVHEFGHFIAAKWMGMRVDEFGIGFPPRAWRFAKKGETEYTLNWLPLGGFVKIYGEDPAAAREEGAHGRAFYEKNRLAQAFVLVAGVAMNMLFAYVLITAALIAGTPRALTPDEIPLARDTQLAVAAVLPDSPAARAGLAPGDVILSAEDGHYAFEGNDPKSFTAFVTRGGGNSTVTMNVRHGSGEEETVFARPETGVIDAEPSRAALGVEVATIGVISLPFWEALKEGAVLTWGMTVLTAQGLWHFFAGVFTASADLSQVAGPVGIAGVVGDASMQGIGYLLSIMAVISINLALINLIPIPALDGGRLLFVLIEAVTRRQIKASVAQGLNALGFALLILLMVVVTTSDIFKLIG